MNSNPSSSSIQSMSLDDLPVFDVNPALSNANLTWCSRRVFSLAGVELQFAPVADLSSLAPAAIWMHLDFGGAPCVLALSAEWASALVQNDGWTLESLDDLSLDMWCRVRWAPLFPPGLLLTQAAFNVEALGSVQLEGMNPSAWLGRHTSTQEPSGHQLQLWTPNSFPVKALAELVGMQAMTVLPSPLASLPIALPLVAARWSVDAEDLIDLGVGDLLLVG